jgi:hypothetical protein
VLHLKLVKLWVSVFCPSQRMCDQCKVQCAVVALPKSVDNDFLMVGAGMLAGLTQDMTSPVGHVG